MYEDKTYESVSQEFDKISDDFIAVMLHHWEQNNESSFSLGDGINDYIAETGVGHIEKLSEFTTHVLVQLADGLNCETKTIRDWARVCKVWHPELRENYVTFNMSMFRALIKDGEPMIEVAEMAIENNWKVAELMEHKHPISWKTQIERIIGNIERLSDVPANAIKGLNKVVKFLRKLI